MALRLTEPFIHNLIGALDKNRSYASQIAWHVRLALMQLAFDGFNQFIDIGGLYDVIIHLLADRLQCGLKRRIASDDDRDRIRLRATHRADNRKSVSRLTDVEIG